MRTLSFRPQHLGRKEPVSLSEREGAVERVAVNRGETKCLCGISWASAGRAGSYLSARCAHLPFCPPWERRLRGKLGSWPASALEHSRMANQDTAFQNVPRKGTPTPARPSELSWCSGRAPRASGAAVPSGLPLAQSEQDLGRSEGLVPWSLCQLPTGFRWHRSAGIWPFCKGWTLSPRSLRPEGVWGPPSPGAPVFGIVQP